MDGMQDASHLAPAGDPCLPPGLGTPLVPGTPPRVHQLGICRAFPGWLQLVLCWRDAELRAQGDAGTCIPLFLAKTTTVWFKSPHHSWGAHEPPSLSLSPASSELGSFPAGLNQSSGTPALAPSPLPCHSGSLSLLGGSELSSPGAGSCWGGWLPACPGRCLCMPSTRALAVKAF